MGSQRRSATATASERVIQAVQTEAREAAAVRWDAPGEVFVWRARRCAEAVLYAVLCQEGVDIDAIAKQRKGLEGLLEHKQLEGALNRETRAQLKALQDFGNIAAHYQLSGGVSESSVDAMGRLLAALLREFYEKDGGALPEGLLPLLAALTDRQSRLRSAAEIEGDRARQRVRELEARLHTLEAAPRTHTGFAPRDRQARTVVLLLGVAMVGGLGGYFVGRSDAAPLAELPVPALARIPRPAPPEDHPHDAALAEPTAPPSPPQEPPPAAPPEAPAPPEVICPDRMVRAGDGCIDEDPVPMGSYRRCVVVGRCARPMPGDGCNWENAQDGLAANCVTWEMARTYCRQQRDGADLPTTAIWNAARGGVARPRTAGLTREWVIDSQTNGMLIGSALSSSSPRWSREGRDRGLRDVSFRCAWTPAAARAGASP